MTSATFTFFATCAKHIEGLLREELLALGAENIKETVAGVSFEGEIIVGYRVCLWSRLANQVILKLSEFDAATGDQLYDTLSLFEWSEHLEVDSTFCIEVSGHHSEINHPIFIAQRAKDAIVDQFRKQYERRPSVATREPNVCFNLHVERTQFILGLNLSGDSLHRRGYRLEAGKAPLKETLAAAILYRAGWIKKCLSSAVFYDPMCGTGTLLIEAAQIAFDIAPGLQRQYFGFLGWPQHRPALWKRLIEEAQQRKTVGLARKDIILAGSDNHRQAILKTQQNVHNAGLSSRIHIQWADCTDLKPLPRFDHQVGLIVTNPPYGERMQHEDLSQLHTLFTRFGECLKQHFVGWELAIISGAPKEYLQSIGIRASHSYSFFNGTLPCRLYQFEIQPERFTRHETAEQKQTRQTQQLLAHGLSDHAHMLANRVRKNLKTLTNWAKREGIDCYRIYDADLPEYAVAVDYYTDNSEKWLHVQEYQAPKEIDPKKAKVHLKEMLAVLHTELQIPIEHIFLKTRQPQKGTAQYEKITDRNQLHIILEGKAQFWVNFTDYLDTGIFLDHRLVRQKVAKASANKTLLNLFAYTCTASVQAVLAGAREVTSIDLSNTYLDWGVRNFRLNHLDPQHHPFIQADCLEWLRNERQQYDVIFLNPPTFSNSKRMTETLDIQRDHVELIELCLSHLKPGGELFFSCNLRNFKLKREELNHVKIQDLSTATLCKDFTRRTNMHHVWVLTKPSSFPT